MSLHAFTPPPHRFPRLEVMNYITACERAVETVDAYIDALDKSWTTEDERRALLFDIGMIRENIAQETSFLKETLYETGCLDDQNYPTYVLDQSELKEELALAMREVGFLLSDTRTELLVAERTLRFPCPAADTWARNHEDCVLRLIEIFNDAGGRKGLSPHDVREVRNMRLEMLRQIFNVKSVIPGWIDGTIRQIARAKHAEPRDVEELNQKTEHMLKFIKQMEIFWNPAHMKEDWFLDTVESWFTQNTKAALVKMFPSFR